MKFRFLIFLINILFFLKSFSQKERVVLTTGHTDQVNCLAISNNGKWLASGGNDKQVKVWDLNSSKEYCTYGGSDGRIEKVAFSKDLEYVVALNYNNQLCVWNRKSASLIAQHNNVNAANSFDVSVDSKFITYLNTDGALVNADLLNSDKKQTVELPYVTKCKLLHDEKALLTFTVKGELILYSFPEVKEIKKIQLFNGSEVSQAHSSIKLSSDNRYAAFSTFNQQIWVIDLENFKVAGTFKGKSLIPDLCFSETEPDILYTIDPLNNTTRWDLKNRQASITKNISLFPAVCIISHPNQNAVFVNLFKEIALCDGKDFTIIKRYSPLAHRLLNLDYDHQGKYLATAGDDISIRLWNLKENRIEHKINGFFPLAFTPDGKKLITMYQNSSLAVWRSEDAYKIGEINCEYELQQVLTVSSDGKYLAGAGYAGIIRVWEIETGKMITKLIGHQGGIYGLTFSNDAKFLASSGMDNSVRVWDWNKMKEIQKFENHSVIASDVKFSPDNQYLASCGWDKVINVYSCQNWQLIKSWNAHSNIITGIAFSPDSKFLASSGGNNVVAEADNKLKIWTVGDFKLFCEMKNETGMINKFVFDEKDPVIYSCGEDGFAKMWDYQSCSERLSFVAAYNNQHLIFTPQHYYTCSKQVLNAVSFVKNGIVYSFDQFDVRYNRPDIISKYIQKAEPELIQAYENACKKRIKRMGFQNADEYSELSLPLTKITSSGIPLQTKDRQIIIEVEFSDSLIALDRYQIYINGIPQHGSAGLSFANASKSHKSVPVKINLVNGKNKIGISCFNKQGIESLVESFEINAIYESPLPKLFVVCIGVSNYKNSEFNLRYPAKDAEDVAKLMQDQNKNFSEVFVKVLKDDQANLENYALLNEFVSKAEANDRLIVFVAGHGVLDEKLDYYFCMQDVDFNDPSLRGLPFEKFEELLLKCKANQKLLLMDTCHSGELDKDEAEKVEKTKQKENNVAFRSVGPKVINKGGIGTQNTLRLMEELFGNVKKGSGATVISSAGGAEYAMESEQWQNGLFTFCFLNGIKNNYADENNDGQIKLSEIKKYVSAEVEKLSNGAQKPTSRSENLELDYSVN